MHIIRATAFATIVMLAGCSTASKTTTRSLSGTLTLSPGAFVDPENDGICHGRAGYRDIIEGAAVVISDEHGDVIATTDLSAGTTVKGEFAPSGCDFTFQADGLADAKFYKVEATHRGQVTYSKADLVRKGWAVHLTVGA